MLDEDFLKEFGFRLKLYRMRAKLTQATLGEMIDISEHRISQIENGKCNVTLKTVNKIADALNIQASKLFLLERE